MSKVIRADGNVLYADFSDGWRKDAAELVAQFELNNSKRQRFLEICAATLDEGDYYDLLDAIQDPVFYRTCDREIQDLVDGYFANTA